MSSHGVEATEALKDNLKKQLNRLIVQLQDLEDLREELEDDEYDEVRRDTLEQMEEIDAQLRKLLEGDVTLVSELGAMKLAIQAAVKKAFKTPEVIRLFAQKEPGQLRLRLAGLRESLKLGRIGEAAFNDQVTEIIVALKKLGEELTVDERKFLEENDTAMKQFEAAAEAIGDAVLSMAGKGVRGAGGAEAAAAGGGGRGR